MADASKIVACLLEDEDDELKKEALSTTGEMDDFTTAYVVAALWSSTDDEGNPLDQGRDQDDVAPETLYQMMQDCLDFQTKYAELLSQAGNAEQNGHDFWLSRNGHGAGFFDRDYDESIRDALQTAAEEEGQVDLYIGDDGLIYS